MKTVSIVFGLLLVTLLSVQANAIVHQPGTFVATECGAQISVDTMSLIDIEKVCMGRLVLTMDQQTAPAVEFHMTTGQKNVFRVISSQAIASVPSIPGHNRFVIKLENEQGEELEMNIVRTTEGRTRFASGQMDVLVFKVQEFEPVFTAMDVIDSVNSDFVPEYHNLPHHGFELQ